VNAPEPILQHHQSITDVRIASDIIPWAKSVLLLHLVASSVVLLLLPRICIAGSPSAVARILPLARAGMGCRRLAAARAGRVQLHVCCTVCKVEGPAVPTAQCGISDRTAGARAPVLAGHHSCQSRWHL
jgi:hypothetical protein